MDLEKQLSNRTWRYWSNIPIWVCYLKRGCDGWDVGSKRCCFSYGDRKGPWHIGDWEEGRQVLFIGKKTSFPNTLALWCVNISWLEGPGLVGLSPRTWHPDWLQVLEHTWGRVWKGVHFGVCQGSCLSCMFCHEGWQGKTMLKMAKDAPGSILQLTEV